MKDTDLDFGKSYKMFTKMLDTEKEDLHCSFWGSVDFDSNDHGIRRDLSYESITDEVIEPQRTDSIATEAAKKASLALSKKIEKENQDTKYLQVFLVCLFLATMLSVGSFIIWGLAHKKENGQLKRKIGRTIQSSNYTPLFLYAPGTGASAIPCALSSCLGFTESRFEGEIDVADYMTATFKSELSGITTKGTNIKLFLLQVNPIVRIPLSFIEMKDPASTFFDPRLSDLTFEEYIQNNTLFEKDLITKRLLGRNKDDTRKLTKYSLERAKDILKRSYTGLFNGYYDAFLQFKDAFHLWDFLSLPAVDECVKTKFKTEREHMEELYKKHGIKFEKYFNTLKELNDFDMELYLFTASSNMVID